MRLNISAWAIRKPIGPLVLFLVLIVLGLVSFRGLPVTRMPNLTAYGRQHLPNQQMHYAGGF